jgi:uncharacterized protein (DUF779 family)
MIKRIGATVEAIELIQTLKEKHGDLMFYQAGCCEGTQPQCFEKEDFTNAWEMYALELLKK